LDINTHRYLEHCGPNNDDHLNYRSSDEIKYWLSNDVIKQTESDLFKIGIDANQLHSSIKKDVDLELENAFAFANAAFYPSIEKSASYEYA
jgi:pyruvate dehydrogenase E1 component alpha subunit